MSFNIVLTINICIAAAALGLLNMILFDTSILFVVIPLVIVLGIVAFWMIRKIRLKK